MSEEKQGSARDARSGPEPAADAERPAPQQDPEPDAAPAAESEPEPAAESESEPEPAAESGAEPVDEPAPEPAAAAAPRPGPRPSGRLRRLVRGRSGAAVIGAVVGALLAAGGLAWQAGELPFTSRDRCWGALSSDAVDRLFSDGEIRTRELSLRSLGRAGGYSTECRLQRWKDDELKWEISARVEQLAQFDGRGAREWTREFLSPVMVPLGGDLPGMVSAGRAWVALPESCVGGRHDDPPTVVSLSSGRLGSSDDDDPAERRRYRAAMAGAVVELANGVLAEKKCRGSYPAPGKLARVVERQRPGAHSKDRLCGLKGVPAPSWLTGEDDSARAMRTTGDTSGLAHSCEYGRDFELDGVRLTTIEDPRLASFVIPLGYSGTPRFRGDGFGSVFGDMSVYVATCQTGPVAFLVQRQESLLREHDPTVELLPDYVAAEAKRVGCGTVRVTGPEPPK
ncbi:hypothetical protein [Streptomyces sp. NPDC007083]|uniref:hypothetical protein n=1 Tax=unclassified Streptomyces TaxID=2593676 RepID=UPI0033EFD0FF